MNTSLEAAWTLKLKASSVQTVRIDLWGFQMTHLHISNCGFLNEVKVNFNNIIECKINYNRNTLLVKVHCFFFIKTTKNGKFLCTWLQKNLFSVFVDGSLTDIASLLLVETSSCDSVQPSSYTLNNMSVDLPQHVWCLTHSFSLSKHLTDDRRHSSSKSTQEEDFHADIMTEKYK